MMTLNKRALLTLLMITSIPLLNACKELNDQKSINDQGTVTETETPETETGNQEPVFAPIQINSVPADLSGYPGQIATFSVIASSDLSLSYQWFHDDSAIEGAVSPTFSFTITDTADAGSYRVDISNSTTSVDSSAVLLVGDLPTISNEPQDVSIYPGQTAIFSVDASGDNVEYEWQRRSLFGWSTLEESGDTLIVEEVSTSTSKQYRVKVKNRGGEKTSRTTRINLKNPISISQQPSDQLVAAGETASFSVTASGYGTLNYRWFKGGAALSDSSKFRGTQTPTLSVVSVNSSDASLYHAVISNEDGRSMASNPAELSVQGPAVVTVHPADTTLYSGSNGELRIGASGDDPMSYQWQKWSGSSWQNISGANSSRLTFNDVSANAAGRYRCVISNTVSSDASNAATVTVLSAVSIVSAPASQTVAVGDAVSFSISATGDNLNYEWRKDGEVMPNTGSTLSFAAVRELDDATYSCRVYNAGGEASCPRFTLNVQAPVAILQQPVSQSTYEGGSATLSVVATGDPAPTVEWYFNEEMVSTGANLTINNISPEQAGEYRCQVSNAINSLSCTPATVTVSSSVRITSQPQNMNVTENENLTLTMSASGEDLNYDWMKDGASLGINSTTLNLSDVSSTDSGSYSCRVWNEFSSANCSEFTLTIDAELAIVTHPVGATAFENSAVSLNVAHTGNSETRVTWYFNDSEIASEGGVLTLDPLTLEQAGEYLCVVANSERSVACNPVQVYVLEQARIVKQPSNQILSTGDTFSIDIEATGEETLTYQCYHNGAQIFNTTDPQSLAISNIGVNHEGDYYCVVSNEGSTVTSDIVTLSVITPSRRVLVTWDAPASREDGSMLDPLDIQGYRIHVCPEGENAFETIATTTGTGTDMVVDLAPGTYTLTVSVIDTNGLESNMSSSTDFVID